MLIACVVQTVLVDSVRKIVSKNKLKIRLENVDSNEYITLLKKIYKDQKGICTDRYHLSRLLFNAVLQNPLKEVTQRWQKKKDWEST